MSRNQKQPSEALASCWYWVGVRDVDYMCNPLSLAVYDVIYKDYK